VGKLQIASLRRQTLLRGAAARYHRLHRLGQRRTFPTTQKAGRNIRAAMKNNEISHPFAAGEAEALASRPNAAEIEL